MHIAYGAATPFALLPPGELAVCVQGCGCVQLPPPHLEDETPAYILLVASGMGHTNISDESFFFPRWPFGTSCTFWYDIWRRAIATTPP